MTNVSQSLRPPFVVGITGASGAVYATRLLEALVELGHHVHLTISPIRSDGAEAGAVAGRGSGAV